MTSAVIDSKSSGRFSFDGEKNIMRFVPIGAKAAIDLESEEMVVVVVDMELCCETDVPDRVPLYDPVHFAQSVGDLQASGSICRQILYLFQRTPRRLTHTNWFLAAASPVFRAMFANTCMRQATERRAVLEDINGATLRLIVQFAFS